MFDDGQWERGSRRAVVGLSKADGSDEGEGDRDDIVLLKATTTTSSSSSDSSSTT